MSSEMKKINIEVQCLCNKSRQIRGIEYVTLELLNAFVKRAENKYSASFFDYGRERNNRELLEEYFKSYGIFQYLKLCECNELDYREIINAWNYDSAPVYAKKDYDEYVNAKADLYYFPQTITLPANLPCDKTVVTIHDILHIKNKQARQFHPEATAQVKRIIDYIVKREDVLITAVSKSTKDDLIEYAGIDSDRITVVYEAYNKQLYWPQENKQVLDDLGIKKPYILYLGGLDAHKGLDVLCKAFDILDNRDIQLVLAGGKCTWYDIDTVVNSVKRKTDVILTGYVSDDQKRVLMSMAEVFVFPSFYEGFGLPVIEAMACGAPVIASNITSLPEVGGDAAVYFEAGNDEELKEKIDKLLDDGLLRNELKEKSLEHSKLFSWDSTAENIEKVFKKRWI